MPCFDDFIYCFGGPNKESLCGEGRYGAVHKVTNKKTNEIFAMKIFRPNSNSTSQTFILQMWQKEYEHLEKVRLKGKHKILSNAKFSCPTIGI